ncbi:sensor histidine kinase [Oscillatoria sp. CS-180]|uniref:sensor histidine kinase n=1 Tax=Oscillatoria sp. CS-180 TaxID=3021720 RepID=UPI00232F2474|nr:sensor histidine kinase [Oscillatoria sp. CS-180]MDB9524482.1 sensor histidine kinase [Oscillatoria sp. CS-180]
MNDLGQVLEDKVEIITERWIYAVHQDSRIESAKQLSYEAVRNSLPEVLKELAELLSSEVAENISDLRARSLCHGETRAQQGYDTAEVTREYRLLRQVILSILEPELLPRSSAEVLHSIRLIDNVFDRIITISMESYIESRLVELRQLQGQLTLTNQELTRLVKVHQDNLSYMAHELKTPLTSIIGHSSILLQKQRKKFQEKDTATNLNQLERVLRNGRRLLQIVNDTLEISRYNQGQIRLDLKPVSIGILIREMIEDGLKPLADEKELELSIEVSQLPELLITDPLRVQQLLTNLVGNAIRYTETGSIQVIARLINDNTWEIRVSDTGIGIEEDARSQIFDPYARSNSQTKEIAGTGLGLAIVQRIIHLMNGKIELLSEVGRGSTFTVTLPLIRPEASH